MKSQLQYYLGHFRQDLSAGIVVFLVALPLCLGIALASGAPLFSGVIAGIVGGVVVAWLSGSQLSVSGPAAGLAVVVFNAIETLGSYHGFLLSLVLAGSMQILLGTFKAGVIGAFFPAAVIKGMLTAIGLILIIKQIPHATGFDVSFDGDESYMQETAESSLLELLEAFNGIAPGACLISGISLLILVVWDGAWLQQVRLVRLLPAPLLAVVWGMAFNYWAQNYAPLWAVSERHLVMLPELSLDSGFMDWLHLPDFSYLSHPNVYTIALTLALIASLETLLSLEAVDKLDPHKRIAPVNRELKAQGLGNLISGMIGGLPITAVIVRSSANINAGGQTRMASFVHGMLLLVSVFFFARFLNIIPLACLAAILLQTGYKLAKPALFVEYYHKGWNQFLPFVITVTAILTTDLLQGIAIGMAIGIFFVLRANFHEAITLTQRGSNYLLRLHKDVSFLNKALLRQHLVSIPDGASLLIDGHKALFIDQDILETIADFRLAAADRDISVEIQGVDPKA